MSAKTESKSSAKVLVGPSMFKIFKGCEKRDYKTVNIYQSQEALIHREFTLQVRYHRLDEFYNKVVDVVNHENG